jgi:hypothetical protein
MATSDGPEHHRLAEHEERDVPRQEADGAQGGDLARALAHAHRDRVAEDERHDREDDDGDDVEGREDGGEAGEEALVEGVLVLAERLNLLVLEERVDGDADVGRARRVGDARQDEADLIAAGLREAVVEVRVVKEHGRAVHVRRLRRVEPADGEGPGLVRRRRVDAALEGDRVAHLPAQLGGQDVADEEAGAIDEEGFLLRRANEDLRHDLEVRGGVDGEGGEKHVLPRGDLAAEPHGVARLGHARRLAHLLRVALRERHDEGHLVAGDEPILRGVVGGRGPRRDRRPQQQKRDHGDGDPGHGERCAHLVAKQVPCGEAREGHGALTAAGGPCPGGG